AGRAAEGEARLEEGARGSRSLRVDDRNRRGHLHARAAGHERVCDPGRRRLPHLLRLRARARRDVGHVSVARPRPAGPQRDPSGVPSSRRVRPAVSEAAEVLVPRPAAAPTPASERAFYAVSTLVFAASATATIVWCGSMSAMGGMTMPGGWTMSMAWVRMPEQTWAGPAAAFLGLGEVMMVAMMMPALVAMLSRSRQSVVAGATAETRLGPQTAIVGAGYFFVWTVFGIAAFPVGVALATAEMHSP